MSRRDASRLFCQLVASSGGTGSHRGVCEVMDVSARIPPWSREAKRGLLAPHLSVTQSQALGAE